jgi:hypothetical protein
MIVENEKGYKFNIATAKDVKKYITKVWRSIKNFIPVKKK